MGWAIAVGLGLLAAAAYLAIDGWQSRRCRYCSAARQAFNLRHPGWRALAGWHTHRATEPDRVVVAVFYRRPDLRVRPDPYRLFAVSRDLSAVEELPDDPHSPYAIRGRK